jgi:hypothetical protein
MADDDVTVVLDSEGTIGTTGSMPLLAPALLKCLKSLGDRRKSGPQRASATQNRYTVEAKGHP